MTILKATSEEVDQYFLNVVINKGHLLPIQSNPQTFLSRRVILRVTICNFLHKTLRRQGILIKKEPNFEDYPFSFYKQFNREQN